MVRFIIATFGILALSTGICNAKTHQNINAHRVKKEIRINRVGTQRGIASWYGRGFNGKRTASGERLNPHILTVAHKTLPFGTIVRITNNDNGLSVIAKVNDRGPYVRNRIVDLSQATASALKVRGTANVTLENIGHEDIEVASFDPAPRKYRKIKK